MADFTVRAERRRNIAPAPRIRHPARENCRARVRVVMLPRMERADLIIIGGGVAGAAAALRARAAGLRTVVVRRSPGASALGGGGWRGPLPAVVADALLRQQLVHMDTGHPLPHVDGELQRVDFAPASHAAAVVETGACVVGIAGLPAYRAQALARLWGAAAEAEVESNSVVLPGTPASGWAVLALARAIERDVAPLIEALRTVVARSGCTRLLLPPVLGVEHATRVRNALEAETGVPVAEALAAAPSLPGWRLQRALERALQAAGIDVIDADVVDVERAPGSVRALDALPRGATETLTMHADRFLLATGRYVGGGIAADPRFAETVFGASVWIEHLNERFDDVDPLVLSDPVRTEAQPLLTAGVRVDAVQRVSNGGTHPLFQNVWAAGAVRAGVADALGAAAADGVRAVDLMLEQE